VFFEECAVRADHKVYVEVDDTNALVVDDP